MNPEGNIIAGVGVVLISPHNCVLSYILANRAKFQQCLRIQCSLDRMQLAEEIGVKNLEAYDDSKLTVNQVRGEYKV